MKSCFKAFGVSFNIDADLDNDGDLNAMDVRHSEGLARSWQGDVMLVDYPYTSWGHMKDSEVFLYNFRKALDKVIADTMKMGQDTASFLTDCGDFKGGVMVCEEHTLYVDEVKGGYRIVVDFQFLCENEDESTDEQCYSIVYMTKDVFDAIVVKAHNVVMN
jgi:hypothetical protein